MKLLLGALCFLLSTAASNQARADKRVALVIGNSALSIGAQSRPTISTR